MECQLLPALAVLRPGDGRQVPGGVTPRAGLLAIPPRLATPLAHVELSRRFFQTSAALPGPLPRLHRWGAQRAGPGLLPTGCRTDACLRRCKDAEHTQHLFQQKGWTVSARYVALTQGRVEPIIVSRRFFHGQAW